MVEDDDIVVLTSCSSGVEGEMLKGWLESNGVFAALQGAHHSAMLGELQSYITVNLLVRGSDVEAATALVEEFRKGRPEWPEAAEIADPDVPQSLEKRDDRADIAKIREQRLDKFRVAIQTGLLVLLIAWIAALLFQ